MRKIHHYSNALRIRSELTLEYLRLCERYPSYPRSLLKKIWTQPQKMEDIIQLSRFLERESNILLIDVGANTGYWAQSVLNVFPRVKMIAFEPDPRAAELHEKRFLMSKEHILHRCALSDQMGFLPLKMAANNTFSSLEDYIENDGGEIVNILEVPIKKLDDFSIRPEEDIDQVFLKIDVQGHELKVIKGAQNTLMHVDVVLLELSFAPEYLDNTPSFSAVACELLNTGHYPIIFQNYGRHRSPYAIQRDVIFVKEPLLSNIYGW